MNGTVGVIWALMVLAAMILIFAPKPTHHGKSVRSSGSKKRPNSKSSVKHKQSTRRPAYKSPSDEWLLERERELVAELRELRKHG